MRFAQPQFFLLLLALLPLAYRAWRGAKRATPKMLYSSTSLMGAQRPTSKLIFRPLPAVLSFAAMVLLIAALARPQFAWKEKTRVTEGIDIMLVIDVSLSMQANDFRPNRLEKAKQVVKKFIAGRTEDQIGVVIFGRNTFTLCPLTRDYSALNMFVDRIDFDLVGGQGTAIGMGLANAVNKLKDSPADSKVAILLTDGQNNAGEISPREAGRIAATLGVRTYAIGVGSDASRQSRSRRGNIFSQAARTPPIDRKMLTAMAEGTGGKFFMASDGQELESIYAEINELEKSELEMPEANFFDELAHWLIVPALALLGFAFLLEQTWLWSFP